MSRLMILALATSVLAAAGCGSDSSTPTTPTPQNTFVFTAPLSAASEVPPVTGPEAGGTGQATLTMHTTRDGSGAITAATMDVSATFSGFPPGTTVTAAHIHQGASGVSGGVVIPMVPGAGEVTMPNGSGSFVHSGFPVPTADLANQLLNNAAGFYFNIHTPANPGGAARGQLSKTQ